VNARPPERDPTPEIVMPDTAPRFTYLGGPTLLIEWERFRILTDPTFDPAGTSYVNTPAYTLRKTLGPALPLDRVEPVDLVLLSHDHHVDNLDHAGRDLLARVPRVITTTAGAARLGGSAVGLEPWQPFEVRTVSGATVVITATPARHGPPGGDRGPVVGFVLTLPAAAASRPIYLTGDTVWYEGVQAVAERYRVGIAVLFAGAARVKVAGDAALTLTAAMAVDAARAFPDALLIPLHYEGWEHFSEGRRELQEAFDRAGLGSRVVWLEPGKPTPLGAPT
jgi:L-ascorbate metabolism protein UlaG (beta-lactamase superfamily)